MSEVQEKLDQVSSENEALKLQLAQNGQGVNNLLAQLEAHRQVFNDSNNLALSLRTNLVLFQKNNQELNERLNKVNAELEDAKRQISSLHTQLTDANVLVAALQLEVPKSQAA